MKRPLLSLGVATIALLIPCTPARAQLPAQGMTSHIFSETCQTCHGNPNVKNASDLAKLRQMSPESIYTALTTGSMRIQAQGLSDDVKRALTEYLAGRKPGIEKIADAKFMPNQCTANASIDLSAPMWNGWGVDAMNTRFQPGPAAGLSANDVPQLKLKWAFGFPGAAVVYSQPTVAGGRVFVGMDTAYVYSIDQATGCVYWSFQAQAGVRSAISVGPVKEPGGAKYGVFFGDIQANVYAVDAENGQLLWKVKVENQPVARITGAPKLSGDRLYVPVASMEEGAGASPKYPCCTFHGSVVALDSNTGRQIWKTYTITEPSKPTRKNSQGVQLWGPSGAGVWDSPTVDEEQHAIYVGIGDAYTGPAPKTTDAIMALDMKTGKVRWVKQDTANDAWITGCAPPHVSENCPDPLGPDYDFGAPPILRTLPNGHRLLIAGQKSGIVWAHDPDEQGALVWKRNLAPTPPGSSGQISWGGAADEQNAYFGLNTGGVAALDLVTGEQKWLTPLDPAPGLETHRGETGPLTAIPGVVFSDGWDGVVRALSADDGHILWNYNTVQEFKTVNGVAAKGGSMGAPGPSVAGGMLFVASGYIGVQNGIPGNVLLAFAPSQ